MLSHICNRYNLNSHKPDLCKKWKYFVTAQAILDSKCLFFFFGSAAKNVMSLEVILVFSNLKLKLFFPHQIQEL